MVQISFKENKMRQKAIGIMFRSPYGFKGIGKNRFEVPQEIIDLLDKQKVSYVKVSK